MARVPAGRAARGTELGRPGLAGAATSSSSSIRPTASFQTGGFGLIQKKNFKRDHFGLSVTKFLGNHEIKGGFEYEKETADVIKRMSGGQQVLVFANPNAASSQPFIYQHNYWTTKDASIDRRAALRAERVAGAQDATAYIQDKWNVLPNLTVNLGVRWDNQQIFDSAGVAADQPEERLRAAFRVHVGPDAGPARRRSTARSAASTRRSRWTS